MMKINFNSLIDRAALGYLKSKKLLPGFSHYDVWLYEHAVAFTVAKMMDTDMLADVQTALTDAMQNGTTFADFKKRLKPYLMAKGWWGESVMLDPEDDALKVVQLGSTRRLRTIFHTNLQTSYAAGQWARIQNRKTALPYLKYIPSAATHKRDAHKPYYNLILPVEHELWNTIFPPNGYGCLCSVRQLTKTQALRERGEDIAKDPGGFTEAQKEAHKQGRLEDSPNIETIEFTNPRTGQTVRIPADITPSFAHNHGDRLGALQQLATGKHGKNYAAMLAAETNNYIRQKIGRPNFIHGLPNLTLKNDGGVANAQSLIFSEAGRGEPLGYATPGTDGGLELVHRDGNYYLLKYSDDGVSVSHLSAAQTLKMKTDDMMLWAEKGFVDIADEKLAQIKAADFGDADFADKLAACIYTSESGYTTVNLPLIRYKGDLRQLSSYELRMVTALDGFLAKAPTYVGTTHRMVNIADLNNPDLFMAAHQPGSILRYSNFTSTTLQQGNFGQDRDVEIIIHGKSGVRIESISQYEQEKEVLMPRTTVYKVKSRRETVDNNGQTRHHIELEEITDAGYDESMIVQLSCLGK
ncbi:phage minor head protein [Neisseria sp. S1]|uniref:phage minor head protein n=1 Tax=Neisseria sp. S1 TaxID=3318354 RepID=UPI003A8B7770